MPRHRNPLSCLFSLFGPAYTPVGEGAFRRKWRSDLTTLVVAGLLANSGSIAVSETPDSADWKGLVEASQSQLNPSSLPDPAPARARLDRAIAALDAFLATSPIEGPRWRRFLDWDAMQAELASPNPNLETLNAIEKGYRQNFFGLELSPFTAVRDALANYIPTQRLGANPEASMNILKNRLGRLAERSALADIKKDASMMHELAQTIAYLKQGNQGQELVATVGNSFSDSNLRVLVAKDFLAKRFYRPVDQNNPVNELILGTTILGHSNLKGVVTAQLIDSPSQAMVRLNMDGDLSTIGRGYNRSVVIHTQGNADVVAGESIALTESGLVPLGDVWANADLDTTICGIEHHLNLVRKIAARKAAEQKPLAEAISEQRIETRLRNQFHQQLASQMSDANSKLGTANSPEWLRLGLSKPMRNSSSSLESMSILWNIRNGVQLGADGPCPMPVESSGITVQLHQSTLANLLDPIVSGRVIKSEDMDSYAAQFGPMAKGMPRKEGDGPWSITLNGFQPVEMLLDDSLIRFRLRTTKLEREGQSLDQSSTVEAAYRVVIADNTVQLVREGDVNVEFSGTQQKGVRAVTLRTFLKNKFEQLFRPELFDKPIDWTERLPESFRDLQLASLTIDDGWMHVQMK